MVDLVWRLLSGSSEESELGVAWYVDPMVYPVMSGMHDDALEVLKLQVPPVRPTIYRPLARVLENCRCSCISGSIIIASIAPGESEREREEERREP